MRVQTVITHALNQGVGPVCMRPGMGTSAAPAPLAHAPLGSAERTEEIVQGAPRVQVCTGCGAVAQSSEGEWDVTVTECSACTRPKLFASTDAFCPDVWTGWAHTTVQNSEGVGVACAEYADALGIEWREPSPVGVSLAKPSDLRNAWMLEFNDLDRLADWFALRPRA